MFYIRDFRLEIEWGSVKFVSENENSYVVCGHDVKITFGKYDGDRYLYDIMIDIG